MTGKDDRSAEIVRGLVNRATSDKTSPDELVEVIVKLAGFATYFATREAETHAEYLHAERERKHTFASVKLTAMAEGATAAKAEAIAEASEAVGTARLREINAQAERLELKALLDGARDVMDAARSKLSWLKTERNHTP